MATIIYCLKHPVTKKIRYVGKTVQALTTRLNAHVNEAVARKADSVRLSHKNNWVLSLLSVGLRPEIEEIETVDDAVWDERERFWISILPDLVNSTIGGENFCVDLHRQGGLKCRGSKKNGESTSRYVGIRQRPDGKWTSQINIKDKQLYIGNFLDEFDAAIAYDQASILCIEDNVKLNFPSKREQYLQQELYKIVTSYKPKTICPYKYIVHNTRCKHWVVSIPGEKDIRLKSEESAVTYVCEKLHTSPEELIRLRTLNDIGTYALPKYKPSVQTSA